MLSALLSSCNVPVPGTALAYGASTAAALTVGAAIATPQAPPGATPVSTPNPSSAILTVTDNVNCRSGAGVNFERLTVVPEGSSVPILARAEGINWWLVDPPDAVDQCWVSGEFGSAAGDVAGVPAATAAPGSSAGAPRRPTNWDWEYSCGDGTTTITWTDAADNENGYRIYLNGSVEAELPANSSIYVDTMNVPTGQELTFGFEAFNDAGASPRWTFTFAWPC